MANLAGLIETVEHAGEPMLMHVEEDQHSVQAPRKRSVGHPEHQTLVDALQELRRAAGLLPYAQIAVDIAGNDELRGCPKEDTVRRVLTGHSLSSWPTVEAIAETLIAAAGARSPYSMDQLHHLWTQAYDPAPDRAMQGRATERIERLIPTAEPIPRAEFDGPARDDEETSEWRSLVAIREQLDQDAKLALPPGSGAIVSTRLFEGGKLTWWTLNPVSAEAKGGAYSVGRNPASDVLLPHNSASRIHAELSPVELPRTGRVWWLIEDKDSFNGTIVDGDPLQGGVPHILKQGSTMQMGYYCFIYVDYLAWPTLSRLQKNRVLGISDLEDV